MRRGYYNKIKSEGDSLNKNELILNYLYESNKIPVWIFEGKKLIFTSAPKNDLRCEEELYAFFGYFLKKSAAEPVVRIVAELELFVSFRFKGENGKQLNFVAGPAFLFDPVQHGYSKRLSVDFIYTKESFRKRVIDTPTVGLNSFCRFAQAAAALLLGRIADTEALKKNIVSARREDMMDTALGKAIFDIREDELVSLYTLESEKLLIAAIKDGDLSKIIDERGMVRYYNNRMRAPLTSQTKHQFEYEVVALVTIATRAAVDGGLDIDTAFSLSDLYLQRIDNHKTTRELEEIARHAIRTFCEKVANSKVGAAGQCSPRIRRAVKYIRAHLHYPISLEEVSEYVKINPKYLSRSFLKETGMKFTEFIQKERIREACVLLRTTEMSCIEIANALSFSSQSYFIKIFSDVMGITPQKYRADGKIVG